MNERWREGGGEGINRRWEEDSEERGAGWETGTRNGNGRPTMVVAAVTVAVAATAATTAATTAAASVAGTAEEEQRSARTATR